MTVRDFLLLASAQLTFVGLGAPVLAGLVVSMAGLP
jgi:hypothetical protein